MAVGGPLFGGGSRSSGTGSKALVEFRAGKMTMTGNLVTADKRKGLVQVEQGDDQLMHFKWKDRTTGVVEDDLIIFPDDIEFQRVKQCTTGRAYVLKFKTSVRRMFFWMQEPKEDKDEEYCKKINEYLNKPPGEATSSGPASGGSRRAAAGLGGMDISSLPDSELQSLLNNMSHQQLVQLFGGGLGLSSGLSGNRTSGTSSSAARREAATLATTAAALRQSETPATTAASAETPEGGPHIQLTDLQSVLSGIKVPQGEGDGKEPSIDLSTGLTGEIVKPLLSNPEFVNKMKELLPKGEQAEEDPASEISSTVSSPQFKQAMQMFTSGLQSGQLAPLIREFNLGEEAVAAATAGNLEAFVKALDDSKTSPPGAEPKDDMPLD